LNIKKIGTSEVYFFISHHYSLSTIRNLTGKALSGLGRPGVGSRFGV
jgi:hypothetical protein